MFLLWLGGCDGGWLHSSGGRSQRHGPGWDLKRAGNFGYFRPGWALVKSPEVTLLSPQSAALQDRVSSASTKSDRNCRIPLTRLMVNSYQRPGFPDNSLQRVAL